MSDARVQVAAIFDGLLRERWAAGDDTVSNVAIAERHLGIDEGAVRKWRSGRKPIPLAALLVLPGGLADTLHERIRQTRARVPALRLAASALRASTAGLEGFASSSLSEDDRSDLLGTILDAQCRLGEMARKLTAPKGGR